MIVGGNIDGVTRVMTTTIAAQTSRRPAAGAALGFVLLAVVGIIYLVVGAPCRAQCSRAQVLI